MDFRCYSSFKYKKSIQKRKKDKKKETKLSSAKREADDNMGKVEGAVRDYERQEIK